MKTLLSFAKRLFVACVLCQSANVHAAAIFTPNSQPTGWVGEVDVSSFDFTDGNQVIFKGDFIKGAWSGNLSAFPVDSDGTVLFTAERWSGGAVGHVDAQALAADRFIVTMKDNGTKIPFEWASLGSAQQSALGDRSYKLQTAKHKMP